MSKVIVEHVGKKGNRGLDGSNGLGVETASYGKLSTPYVEIFKVNKIADGLTWSRDSEAAFQDRYNTQEIVSAPKSKQVLDFTNDFQSIGWSNVSGNFSVTATGVSDPFGFSSASQITLSDPTGDQDTALAFATGAKIGSPYRVSMYIQLVSGTIDSIKVAMSGIDYAGASLFDISEIGAGWVRISTVVSAVFSDILRFTFATTGAVINLYQVNLTEGVKLYDLVFTNGAAPTLFNTDSIVYRDNKKGYLIEQGSQNLALYSEDFSEWEVSGATVSSNTDFDTFDSGGSETLLTINETSASLLISGLNLTQGLEYSVSVFPVVVSGSVASIGVSLGGGNAQIIEPKSFYDRSVVSCVAGAGNSISITLTTESTGTVIALAGIQVEQGAATTYIPTSAASSSRLADEVSFDEYGLPSLIQPYTMLLGWNDVPLNSLDKYILNSDNLFSVRIVNSNLILNSKGNDILTHELEAPESSEVFFVADGVNMLLYVDKVFKVSVAYTGELGQPSSFNVGSGDGIGGSALNGYIERLTFWDFALSSDDIKYMSEDL